MFALVGDTEMDGKKTMVINELQSDLFQKADQGTTADVLRDQEFIERAKNSTDGAVEGRTNFRSDVTNLVREETEQELDEAIDKARAKRMALMYEEDGQKLLRIAQAFYNFMESKALPEGGYAGASG